MSEKTKTAINYGIMYLGFIAMVGSIIFNLFAY
jgi:hypothetical protein